MTTATPAQADLIRRMMQSHVVTADERAGIEDRLANGFTKGTPHDCIEWLKDTLATRKAAEKAATEMRLPL